MIRAKKSYRRTTVKQRLGQPLSPYQLDESVFVPKIVTTKGLACQVADVWMDVSPKRKGSNAQWLWKLVGKINRHPNPVVSVYINGFDLDLFYSWGLPFVRKKIVLVTGDCDNDVDANYRFGSPLDHPKVVALHAQNLDIDDPRAHPFPIGLDFHTARNRTRHLWTVDASSSPGQQETDIMRVSQAAKPFAERTHGTLVSFSLGTKWIPRSHCVVRLKQVPSSYLPSEPIPRADFWALMADYQFVASPVGCGYDCHRTWEALALGAVPIIMRIPTLSPLFSDLPVWEVDDYVEVTPEALRAKEKEVTEGLATNRYNFEKLTVDWWRKDVQKTVDALS